MAAGAWAKCCAWSRAQAASERGGGPVSSGLVLFAAGMALAGTPATTAIVASLPPAQQGVASAVNDTSREVGSALGIAVLGSVLNERYRSGVQEATAGRPAEVARRAEESIAFAHSEALARLGPSGRELVAQAEFAFVEATSAAVRVAAVVLLAAAVYVGLRAPRRGSPAPAVPAGADPRKAGAAAAPAVTA